ncbi:MAG TPA: S1C family serine protease [Terriglobales bacterium]|nr:S1C family serine protease [Terriglobales bacterium]
MATSLMESLSNEFASAAERHDKSVVAVHARRWMPSSGIEWKRGVIVTANHGIRRDEDIHVLTSENKPLAATLAGRDPSTDLAVLRVEGAFGAVPELGDSASLKLGHLVLALGRSRRGNLVASAGMVGGIAGEFRTWRGGKLDQHIRLDLSLYPGLSGGPLVNAQGKVVGVNTNGLARGRAITIPVSTVNRVVDELLETGHIARPYLGLAMQPVAIPEAMRGKLKFGAENGLLVVHVETGGPGEKGGVLLGDVLVEVQGKPVQEMETITELLAAAKVGQTYSVTVLRGGNAAQLSITLGERPGK